MRAGVAKQAHEEALLKAADQNRVMAWMMPTGFNQGAGPVYKPDIHGLPSINFSVLRSFAVNYPIARACINRLITQITGLDWAVVPKNPDDRSVKNRKAYQGRIDEMEAFLKHPTGSKSVKWRRFLSTVVEDIIVLDALALYRKRTRGGGILGYLPVDGASIRLKMTDSGETPEPPAVAYEQVYQGAVVAQLTTDEMIYDVMNPRTNSPYGLAPLESLIIQVKAALAGALYDLNYFTSGNVPEGMIALPEDWTKDEIKEFESAFNLLLAGDPRMQRRLKFVPYGSQLIYDKKPVDQPFEKFELWLLQQTCSVFGVPPQDIGFTYQVNKAVGEVQLQLGTERGLRPLANFLRDLFDDILQEDFGHADLAYLPLNLDPSNLEEEAKVAEIKFRNGVLSGDEWREGDGKEPNGLGHVIIVPGVGPIKVSEFVKEEPTLPEPTPPVTQPENGAAQKVELKRWKKVALSDVREGRPFRKFESSVLDPDLMEEIESRLEFATTKGDVFLVFEPFLSGESQFVKVALALREELKAIAE